MTVSTKTYFYAFRHPGTANTLLKERRASKKIPDRLFSKKQKRALHISGKAFIEAQPFTRKTHDRVLISIYEKPGI